MSVNAGKSSILKMIKYIIFCIAKKVNPIFRKL